MPFEKVRTLQRRLEQTLYDYRETRDVIESSGEKRHARLLNKKEHGFKLV